MGLWVILLSITSTVLAENQTTTATYCEPAAAEMVPKYPTSYPKDFRHECYAGGRCTVFAIANVTLRPLLEVADDYARFLKQNDDVPSSFSVNEYLRKQSGYQFREANKINVPETVQNILYE